MIRSQKLLILLILLIAGNAFFIFTDNNNESLSYDRDQFKVEDTVSIIQVIITNGKLKNRLNFEGKWKVNDRYELDESFGNVMLAVLNQIRVKKPVSQRYQQKIDSLFEVKGKSVEILTDDDQLMKFMIVGNEARTISYARNEANESYIVEIPGYKDYVAAIFELTENQWRDRTLFSSTWRTIQSLTIKYPKDNALLNIEYNNDFFNVEGVDQLDSAALDEYLALYNNFKVNEIVDTSMIQNLDSILQMPPQAIIALVDIDKENSLNVELYPSVPDENFYLFKKADGLLSIVDTRRCQRLLARPSDFTK